MNPSELFKLLIALEDDIAKFYGKLKNVSTLNKFVKVFELMEQQSTGHSRMIRQKAFSFEIEPLDVKPIYKLHNEIKKSLFERVMHQGDIEQSMKMLADAEELIGNLYQSIANYYKRIADYYNVLVATLDGVGDEEFMHRDAILNSISKLAK